jgi:hypothetical protein
MASETPIPGGGRASGLGPRILLRHYFSTHLLWAAFNASAKAGEIEDAHSGESTFDIKHRGYVLSAIVSAAAFLEATVNELFQDAYDEHNLTEGYLAPLPDEAIEAMAATWWGTDEGSKLNALEKWQLIRIFAGSEPLDRGAAPYQDAQLVVQLRNAVVHYRPESIGADEPHKMEERLKGKFADNRLMEGSGNAWWPSYCLGHGCAEWAARSALALADRVCGDLGIKPNYRLIADRGWHDNPPGSLGN